MIFQTILVKSTCTAPLHDHHHLRYIRKIGYCAAYHLKRAIILPAQAIALVREPMPWQELPIVGLAALETTEEVENGTRLTTTKLTATPTTFRLTDVRGNTYLLGTAEHPYPLITQTHAPTPSELAPTTPSPSTTPQKIFGGNLIVTNRSFTEKWLYLQQINEYSAGQGLIL